jgi:hypothetical protein
VARQLRGPLAVRHARQAAKMEPGALQRLRDRTALMACHSGDENRSIAHGLFPLTQTAVRQRATLTRASLKPYARIASLPVPSNASHAFRASILQRSPFCPRTAALIRSIVEASSGSSGCITPAAPNPLCVIKSSNARSSACVTGNSQSSVNAVSKSVLRDGAGELSPVARTWTIRRRRSGHRDPFETLFRL